MEFIRLPQRFLKIGQINALQFILCCEKLYYKAEACYCANLGDLRQSFCKQFLVDATQISHFFLTVSVYIHATLWSKWMKEAERKLAKEKTDLTCLKR